MSNITFEKYNEMLKNKNISDFYNNEFDKDIIFEYPKDLDERSGYFLFMFNYVQKQMFLKLKLNLNELENEDFTIKKNSIYYKNKQFLIIEESEINEVVFKKYIYVI